MAVAETAMLVGQTEFYRSQNYSNVLDTPGYRARASGYERNTQLMSHVPSLFLTHTQSHSSDLMGGIMHPGQLALYLQGQRIAK